MPACQGSLPLQQHLHTRALPSKNMWNSKIPEQAILSYLFLQDLFFSTQPSGNWKREVFSSSFKLFQAKDGSLSVSAGSWWHFYFGGLSHQGNSCGTFLSAGPGGDAEMWRSQLQANDTEVVFLINLHTLDFFPSLTDSAKLSCIKM